MSAIFTFTFYVSLEFRFILFHLVDRVANANHRVKTAIIRHFHAIDYGSSR